MRGLRPSALPRIAICPASLAASENCPDSGSDATALGQALHELVSAHVAGLEMDPAAVAKKYAVDAESVEAMASGIASLGTHDGRLSEHAVEIRLSETLVLRGTADLVDHHEHEGWAEVIDAKTSNVDFAHPRQIDQVIAYAIGAADEINAKMARATLWYARLGADGFQSVDVDVETERERLRLIVELALSQIELPPERRRYEVRDAACTFCPARNICPARTGEVRAFLSTVMDPPITSESWTAPLLTVENIGRFDSRLRMVEKLVEAAKEARKEFVRAHGSSVSCGDGFKLVLKTEHRSGYLVSEKEIEILRRVRDSEANT